MVLYSSNSTGATTASAIPTVGISAHKFILSSCSQYFTAIFETSPVANTGPIHIVLPPDLSHRAIQILVQYMYMGEATVANDILNEVLKGGEILKIRGLCRTNTPHATNLNQTTTQNGGTQASYNLTRIPLPVTTASATSVRYLVEQPPPQPVLGRGLIASVLPKDSPVIIKTAKPLSTLVAATTTTTTAAGVMGKLTTSAIGVNKHVAIDPGDTKCGFVQNSTHATLDLREEPTTMCHTVGCTGCSRIEKNQIHQIIIPRDHTTDAESGQHSEYIPQTTNDCIEQDPSLMYEHEMELTTTTLPSEQHQQHSEGILSYTGANTNYNYTHLVARPPNHTVLVEGDMQHLVSTSPTSSHEPTTTFVAIKEEPTEWLPPPPAPTNNPTQHQIPMDSLKKNMAILGDFKAHNIKSEPVPTASTSSLSSALSSSHDAAKENGQHLLSGSRIVTKDFERYFSCDICKKTCEDKSSLLRHLETHSATPCTSGFNNASTADATASTSTITKSYVPKKRRRTSVI